MEDITKTLETLTEKELKKVSKIIKEIRMKKKSYLKISEEIILLEYKENDISQFGETFHANEFTHKVKTKWEIEEKIYMLTTKAEGVMSSSNYDIAELKQKWTSEEPIKKYKEIAEEVGKHIAESVYGINVKGIMKHLKEKKMIDNIKNTEKKFWVQIHDDYRSGPSLYIYDKPPKKEDGDEEDEETPEDACEFSLIVPKTGKRFYIVNEFPKYTAIWHNDSIEDYEKTYLKLFSQIHDCMPFEVFGHDCAYKEEGEYPEVPDEIKDMPEIAKDITDMIKDSSDYYFVCVIDNEVDVLFAKLLMPIS